MQSFERVVQQRNISVGRYVACGKNVWLQEGICLA